MRKNHRHGNRLSTQLVRYFFIIYSLFEKTRFKWCASNLLQIYKQNAHRKKRRIEPMTSNSLADSSRPWIFLHVSFEHPERCENCNKSLFHIVKSREIYINEDHEWNSTKDAIFSIDYAALFVLRSTTTPTKTIVEPQPNWVFYITKHGVGLKHLFSRPFIKYFGFELRMCTICILHSQFTFTNICSTETREWECEDRMKSFRICITIWYDVVCIALCESPHSSCKCLIDLYQHEW